MIHEVAWTTGSELLGELGAELERIQELHESDLPEDISEGIARALAFVRSHWPDGSRA